MRRLGWRSAASTAAPFVVAACALLGCSLLTDLGGLSGGDPGTSDATVDRSSAETSSTTEAGDASGDVVQGGYAPRYERSLTITNASSVALVAGYTACFRGTPRDLVGDAADAGKVRMDAGDLRIFAAGVEIPRVLDVLRTGMIALCFRLVGAIAAGASDASYAVRYGDPNAVPPLRLESAVFDFFDGFDGTALAARWLSTGAPVVAGGVVTLPKGPPSAITTVAGSDAVPLDTSLEVNARITSPSSTGQLQDDAGTRYYYWFGFQHLGDFEASPPWSIFIARDTSTVRSEHRSLSGACSGGCDEVPSAQTTDARVYKIDRAGNNVTFTYDTGSTFHGVGSNSDLSIMIRNYLVAGDVVIDWVRARPLVVPEPVPAIGPEVLLPP